MSDKVAICETTCPFYHPSKRYRLDLCNIQLNNELYYPYNHSKIELGSNCRFGLTIKEITKYAEKISQSQSKHAEDQKTKQKRTNSTKHCLPLDDLGSYI